jgi:hypothetical protein
VKVALPALWSAVAELTTILFPSATEGRVFAVSRKMSSVIGLSGVNEMCSVPRTLARSELKVKANATLGRSGSGGTCARGQELVVGVDGELLGAADPGDADVDDVRDRGEIGEPLVTVVQAVSSVITAALDANAAAIDRGRRAGLIGRRAPTPGPSLLLRRSLRG